MRIFAICALALALAACADSETSLPLHSLPSIDYDEIVGRWLWRIIVLVAVLIAAALAERRRRQRIRVADADSARKWTENDKEEFRRLMREQNERR